MHASQANPHQAQDVVNLFNALFTRTHATQLQAGAAEPLYTPASLHAPLAIIAFREDYFSSALHEVAHWCVAGPARRQQVDFGYWYAADGRSPEQQLAFEQVEVKPQALEWVFSVACQKPFQVSADNLALGLGPSPAFKQAIAAQAKNYCQQGLPPRPLAFAQALAQFYGGHEFLNPQRYTVNCLTH